MIAVFAEIQDMLYDVVEEAEDMIKIVMTTLLGDSSMAPELTSYLDFMSDLPAWFDEADVEFQFLEVLLDPILQPILGDPIKSVLC